MATAKKSANTQKRKPPKTAWKPGESGNPAGAPRRGQSWAEIFNSVGELTSQEAMERASKLWATTFKRQPAGVTLKELVVIRAYATLLDESNASLLREVMDRAEGKVKEKVDITSNDETIGSNDDARNKILSQLARIAAATGADAVPEQPDKQPG